MAQRLESLPLSVQQAVLKAMAKEKPLDIKPKPNKFGAIKTEVDGQIFDSRAEARRHKELEALQQNGIVRKLATQVPYPLKVNGITIGKYIADFVYEELVATSTECGHQVWALVVEDVKGVRTAVYQLKKRHIRAQYNITIRETMNKKRKGRKK